MDYSGGIIVRDRLGALLGGIPDKKLHARIRAVLKKHMNFTDPLYRIVAWEEGSWDDDLVQKTDPDLGAEAPTKRTLPAFFYTSRQESSRYAVFAVTGPTDIQQVITFSNLESAKACKEFLESIDWSQS